jgi:choline dehydrogenase-like flavoprotein
VVFLLNAGLVGTNAVTAGAVPGAPVKLAIQRAPVGQGLRDELRTLTGDVLALFDAQPIDGLGPFEADLGGVAHEVGTLRLGESPAQGVVDVNLKFHGYENLYACDLSVFASSPAANPTLTLAALAIRLADHLATQG